MQLVCLVVALFAFVLFIFFEVFRLWFVCCFCLVMFNYLRVSFLCFLGLFGFSVLCFSWTVLMCPIFF